MNKTKIEYLNFTWSPVTGCSPVSAGCEHCYARRMHERGLWTSEIKPFSEVILHPYRLDEPLRRKKGARIGVAFMGDLFHEKVPDSFITSVFFTMSECPAHMFVVLSKRAQRMQQFLSAYRMASGFGPDGPWPLPNVWLGVSVEDQPSADERIPLLLQTPAALRYVSYEPALGPVDFHFGRLHGTPGDEGPTNLYTPKDRISWVICGGESGPGARPMNPDWARSLRDQCQASGVPYYFKQWGEWAGYGQATKANGSDFSEAHRWDSGIVSLRVGKKAAGCTLDGREWKEMPKC